MKFSGLSWIGLIILLAACDTGSQSGNRGGALEEEIRNREPKKLSEAQIFEEAFRQGGEIADKASAKLLAALQEAIEKEGISGAVEFCNLKAFSLTDSSAGSNDTAIKRTSLELRNPENAPTKTEQQLLEAYAYNAEQNIPPDANVQKMEQKYLLYTRPIVINNSLCLQCHGIPGKDIAPKTLQVLDSLYPEDKARSYQMGDIRGMWSIKLLKKDVVNAL